MKEQKWTHDGVMLSPSPVAYPGSNSTVRMSSSGTSLAISGRTLTRMLPGDKVKIVVSRYDSTRGFIIFLLRNKDSGD